jgi:hypothetical protein
MIILREQNTSQSITFIPRVMSATTIVLRNETTNVETTIAANFTVSSYYLTTTNVLALKENTFYNLTIKNGSNIVYKDKIFCTNQVVEDFTVNKNEYVANTTTNEFKIYE